MRVQRDQDLSNLSAATAQINTLTLGPEPLIGMFNTNYPIAVQDGTVLFADLNIAINGDTALIGNPPGGGFPDLLGLSVLGMWRKTGNLSYSAQFITIISNKTNGTPLSRFKETWTIVLAADGLSFTANQRTDVYAIADIAMVTILNTFNTPVNGSKIVF